MAFWHLAAATLVAPLFVSLASANEVLWTYHGDGVERTSKWFSPEDNASSQILLYPISGVECAKDDCFDTRFIYYGNTDSTGVTEVFVETSASNVANAEGPGGFVTCPDSHPFVQGMQNCDGSNNEGPDCPGGSMNLYCVNLAAGYQVDESVEFTTSWVSEGGGDRAMCTEGTYVVGVECESGIADGVPFCGDMRLRCVGIVIEVDFVSGMWTNTARRVREGVCDDSAAEGSDGASVGRTTILESLEECQHQCKLNPWCTAIFWQNNRLQCQEYRQCTATRTSESKGDIYLLDRSLITFSCAKHNWCGPHQTRLSSGQCSGDADECRATCCSCDGTADLPEWSASCPTWKGEGHCENNQFSSFMASNCGYTCCMD